MFSVLLASGFFSRPPAQETYNIPRRPWFSLRMKILITLAFTASFAFAEAPKLETRDGIVAKRDVAYVPGGGARQMLDVFYPEKSDKPLPLIVWIHGGAWLGGGKEHAPAMPFLKDGFIVASVTYRFSQDAIFPAQIQDCKAAIRWLRGHAAELNIDPKRVGVWGASAGGHLVALLGVAGEEKGWDVGENLDQSSRVQAVVNWFGPANMDTIATQNGRDSVIAHAASDSPEAKLIGGTLAENPDKARAASPVNYVTKDDAPMLLMHGDKDRLVPHAQSVELLDLLKKAGVEAELKTMEGAGHGDGAFRTPEAIAMVREFFVKHLK